MKENKAGQWNVRVILSGREREEITKLAKQEFMSFGGFARKALLRYAADLAAERKLSKR